MRIFFQLLLIVALFSASPVQGAQFNVVFSGVVGNVFADASQDPVIAQGDAWEIGFLIDTEAAALCCGDGVAATYIIAPGLFGTVGDFSFATPDTTISMFDDFPTEDQLFTQWRNPLLEPGLVLVEFQRSGPDLFDSLPDLSVDLYAAEFLDDWLITLAFGDSMGGVYNARLTAQAVEFIPVNPVPLPGALLLLGSALFGAAGLGRKRQD